MISKPQADRGLSPREETLLNHAIGRRVMSIQSAEPLDRNRARDIISRAYREIGLAPPSCFYFAPDLSVAYEAVFLLVNPDFCRNHFEVNINPGPRVMAKAFETKLRDASDVLRFGQARMAAQIENRIENSRASRRVIFSVTEDILDLITFLWGNPEWVPRDRFSESVIRMERTERSSRIVPLWSRYLIPIPQDEAPDQDDFFGPEDDQWRPRLPAERAAPRTATKSDPVSYYQRKTLPLTAEVIVDLERQIRSQDGRGKVISDPKPMEGTFLTDVFLSERPARDPVEFLLLPAIYSWLALRVEFLRRLRGGRGPKAITAMTHQIPAMAAFRELCVVVERPQALHFNLNGLHRDGGPALDWGKSVLVHALNGIRVPPQVAETPADKLDAKQIFRENNADIRREIVRKVGIERIFRELDAKVIDRDGDYELVLLDLGRGERFPYLKMRNPSIDAWHVEGVRPEIATVRQALDWRNDTSETPVVLT